MRLSGVQSELLALMAQGVVPKYRPGPAAVVMLPNEHDRAWRKAHGGKPVLFSTLQALVKRGLVTEHLGTGRVFTYVLTSDSQRFAD